jgi:CBS domain-containing protein
MSDLIRRRVAVTLPPTATVQLACQRMREYRVGAILITDESGKLQGIFTGRDTVRLLADGHNAAHTPLDAVMTRNPDTMPPSHSAMDALRMMQDGGYRHVPVVDDGRLVGIVSHGDFHVDEYQRIEEEIEIWQRI